MTFGAPTGLAYRVAAMFIEGLERDKYLDIIPMLWELRKRRRAEIEWERHFVNLVAGEMTVPADEVWQAVEWWKRRVKMIRPITQDEDKSHRMIKRKLGGAWENETEQKYDSENN